MSNFCIGINDITLFLMLMILLERHLTVDSLRFKVDFFKHHQKLIHLWGFVPLHSTTNKKVVCCTWSCKTFLLGSYREFLVFSSNSGAVTNMHRTLKNGFHREQQYTLIFHRKKNYSRKNKNCQNFLKNSIESKLCLARCVTFWWEDALCEALRFHKETWEEK